MKALLVSILVLASTQAMARPYGNSIDLAPGSRALINVDSPTVVTCTGSTQSNQASCEIEKDQYGYYNVVKVTASGTKSKIEQKSSLTSALEALKSLKAAGLCD